LYTALFLAAAGGRKFFDELDLRSALALEGLEFSVNAAAFQLSKLGFEVGVFAGAGQLIEGFGGGFFLGDRLFKGGQLGKGVIRFAYAGQGLRYFALGEGGVFARDQSGGGTLAFFNLVLEVANLLLQRIAGLTGGIDGGLQGRDLFIGLSFLGESFAREIFVAGVEGNTGAILPLLRLANILLLFGVKLVVIAHGHGGGLHHLVELGFHVLDSLTDSGFEVSVFDAVHAGVHLAASDAARTVEDF
jgi:hypothetical protein